jgi:uncharacterized protein YcfJ
MLKIKFATLILAAAVSSSALAGHDEYADYARVVAAQPVYERVARSVPQEHCRIERVRYEHPSYQRPSATGTLVGAMLGAAVGHQVGNGKDGKKVGRIAGALLGASIGSDRSRHSAPVQVEYRDEERCDVSYSTRYDHVVVGYESQWRRCMSKPGSSIQPSARSRRRALLCLACAGLMVAAPAQADRGGRHSQGGQHEAGKRSGQGDGAARAAAIAQSRYGGKVLKVTPQGGGSYDVRLLLPDGTVKSVTVDAGD